MVEKFDQPKVFNIIIFIVEEEPIRKSVEVSINNNNYNIFILLVKNWQYIIDLQNRNGDSLLQSALINVDVKVFIIFKDSRMND